MRNLIVLHFQKKMLNNTWIYYVTYLTFYLCYYHVPRFYMRVDALNAALSPHAINLISTRRRKNSNHYYRSLTNYTWPRLFIFKLFILNHLYNVLLFKVDVYIRMYICYIYIDIYFTSVFGIRCFHVTKNTFIFFPLGI